MPPFFVPGVYRMANKIKYTGWSGFPWWGSRSPKPHHLNLSMSTYYWDLYVLYIKNCERENYINDVDPNHYKMEWNHFWPKCVFGVWPVGQWLTLKQHAIVSALQTLVFKKNCMCGWHKSHLPPALLKLAWPYFCEASGERVKKLHEEKDENGKSLYSLRLHEEKDENGKSLLGLKCAASMNAEKDEKGKSVNAVKGGQAAGEKSGIILNATKDENGKSVNAVKGGKNGGKKGGKKGGTACHAKKDNNGKSLHNKKINSQVWESTVDGFRGNAGNVARYNRARGWPGEARIRIS